jgi:hypothetical protein
MRRLSHTAKTPSGNNKRQMANGKFYWFKTDFQNNPSAKSKI